MFSPCIEITAEVNAKKISREGAKVRKGEKKFHAKARRFAKAQRTISRKGAKVRKGAKH
jgi:hypothetical protein